MFKFYKSLAAIAGSVVLFAVLNADLGYSSGYRSVELAGNFERALREQLGSERSWRSRAFKKEFTLDVNSRAPIYAPLDVETDNQGNIYVLDWPDLSVKKYDASGRFLQQYGKGKGQGPGEIEEPSDLAVDDHGRIWVCDPANGRLTLFSADGSVYRIIKMNLQPSRVVVRSDGGYFVFSPTGNALLHGYRSDTSPTLAFGSLIRNQLRNGIALDGWLGQIPAKGGDDLVFAAYKAGILIRYKPTGELVFARWTIDPVPFPTIVTDASGGVRVDRRARFGSLGLSVSEGKIYTLAVRESALGKRQGAVDVYDGRDGTYSHSYRLPGPANRVHVTRDAWYTLSESSVTKWGLAR